MSWKTKEDKRKRRHLRVRRRIVGVASRPRLSVHKSLGHIYAQIIDDDAQRTLAYASSVEPAVKSEIQSGGNIAAATKVGALVAQRAKEKGLAKVVFDRGGYIYHGRVKALAEAAREGGLEF